jgi:hypothetical protein
MDTIKIEGFICKTSWDSYTFFASRMDQHGYMTVCPHTLEFTIPEDFNPVAAELSMLEKRLDSLADEYAEKVKPVKDRIANLKCIEYTPATADEPMPF